MGMIGRHRQRAVVARQRLLEPLQLPQRNAAVVEGVRIVRPHRQRAIAEAKGFLMAA